MKIELKALKYSDFASQETHCFQANIYIDGKMKGTADNDGRGGMTTIRPWQLHNEIKLYTDKIPPKVYTYGDQSMTLEASPDSYIDELVTLALHERDLKRAMKTRILFTRENQVFETTKFSAAQMAVDLASPHLKERLKADQILNLLPVAEALKLYAAGMA